MSCVLAALRDAGLDYWEPRIIEKQTGKATRGNSYGVLVEELHRIVEEPKQDAETIRSAFA